DAGCHSTHRLYFENDSFVNDPADYRHDPPNGCWSYARLGPANTPVYGTKCKYDPGATSEARYQRNDIEKGSPEGTHLVFDDTNSRQDRHALENDLQWCADYGAAHYGDGKL